MSEVCESLIDDYVSGSLDMDDLGAGAGEHFRRHARQSYTVRNLPAVLYTR